MKQIWILLVSLTVCVKAQAQTWENLLLNSDFEAVEYDFSSNIKRIDIPHARPQHWTARSGSGVQVFQVKDTSVAVRDADTRKRLERLRANSPDSMFVSIIYTGQQSEVGLFSRQYIFVNLSRPLKPEEVCRLELKVYSSGCLGLEGMGFRLYEKLPDDFHLLTPLVDGQAKILPFPEEHTEGVWFDLALEFKAQGGEKILGLGCFLAEADLNLYRLKGRRKRPCNGREQEPSFQNLILAKPRLWVKKASTY